MKNNKQDEIQTNPSIPAGGPIVNCEFIWLW